MGGLLVRSLSLPYVLAMSRVLERDLYEHDFFAWTLRQSKELRRFARTRPNLPLDLDRIAEEIADLGKEQRNAVRSWTIRLIEHLLLLDHSPAKAPRRGWQQGATLLDWGFAQPPDATVGRLVEPGEVTPPAAPDAEPESATSAGPTPGATRPGRTAPGTAPVSMTDSMTGAAMVLAVAAPLVLLVALARRARRRIPRRAR